MRALQCGVRAGKVGRMKIYRLKLTDAERADLEQVLSKGKAAARTLTHARICSKQTKG